MRFVEEVVVETLIPTLRALLAERLLARGARQEEVASLLGISQSAVSKYAQGRLPKNRLLSEDPRVLDAVRRVADGLYERTLTPFQALAILMDLTRTLEARGPLCLLHEESMPSLRGMGCDLCLRGLNSALLSEGEALEDVREGVRILEASADLSRFIPHVGSNLVRALPSARGPFEVVGVPGGLHEIRGRVRAAAPPELGASKHVSEILLAIRKVHPDVGSVLNVKTSPELLSQAKRAGLSLLQIPSRVDRDPALLSTILSPHRRPPDILHHRGGFGIEAITYLLAPTAREAAQKLLSLLSTPPSARRKRSPPPKAPR